MIQTKIYLKKASVATKLPKKITKDKIWKCSRKHLNNDHLKYGFLKKSHEMDDQ